MVPTIQNYEDRIGISSFLIEKTAKRLKLIFSRLLLENKIGITVDQWVVLKILNKTEGMAQSQLAEESAKDAPTITRIIDILVGKNLVHRKLNENDRRKFTISLTYEGKLLVKSIKPMVKAFKSKAYEGLSKKQLNTLKKAMKTIDMNLDKQFNNKNNGSKH